MVFRNLGILILAYASQALQLLPVGIMIMTPSGLRKAGCWMGVLTTVRIAPDRAYYWNLVSKYFLSVQVTPAAVLEPTDEWSKHEDILNFVT